MAHYYSAVHNLSGLTTSAFTITGTRDVVLRTKKPVPEELDIRSFQLVEIRRD